MVVSTWILRIFLIIVPLLVALYWVMLKRREHQGGDAITPKERLRAIAGGVLALIALVLVMVLAPLGGHSPDDVYIAPRQVDGKIIPGEFISREEAAKRGLLDKITAPPDEELEPFGD